MLRGALPRRLVGPEAFARAQFGDDAKLLSRIKALIPKFLYELLEVAYNLPAYLRLKKAADAAPSKQWS